MSHVTNVLLTCGPGEFLESDHGPDTYPCIDAINDWLIGLGQPPLLHVDPLWCGGKAVEADIWIGGFNYLDVEQFVDTVKRQHWDDPDHVQLFIKEQWDTLFKDVFSE